MARPVTNTIAYFSHDTDMSEDDKIEKLEYKYGLAGYAIYNKILEKVYRNPGNFTIKTDEDFKLYSKKWELRSEKLKEMIALMRELNLFPAEGFVSNGVKKRMKKIKDERDRKRNYYKKKEVAKRILDVQNTAKTQLKDVNQTDYSEQSKLKEIKSNQTKSNQTKSNQTKSNQIKSKETKSNEIKEKENNININNINNINPTSGKPERDFIDELLNLFLVEFKIARNEDYVLVSREKERSAISKLLVHYKNQNPDKNTEETLNDFENIFRQSFTVNDKFLQENISPSMILTKLNFIKTKLKGENYVRNNKTTGTTTSEMLGAVAKALNLIKQPADN